MLIKWTVPNWTGTAPFIQGRITVCYDFLAIAKDCDAFRILLDSVDGSIEIGRFAIGREDFLIEKVPNASLLNGTLAYCAFMEAIDKVKLPS